MKNPTGKNVELVFESLHQTASKYPDDPAYGLRVLILPLTTPRPIGEYHSRCARCNEALIAHVASGLAEIASDETKLRSDRTRANELLGAHLAKASKDTGEEMPGTCGGFFTIGRGYLVAVEFGQGREREAMQLIVRAASHLGEIVGSGSRWTE